MDIKQHVDAVTAIQVGIMRATQPHLRGQHFKMHGMTEAVFEVIADLPGDLKVGLFQEPKAYKAVLRFSNGSQQDDCLPDIHGMAIKVYGVEGARAFEAAPAGEQDFVLADHPVFFIRTAAEYAMFMQEFARTAPRGEPPTEFIDYLRENHSEDVAVLSKFRQQLQESPLTATYWSQLPYALNDLPTTACRYRAVPRVAGTAGGPGQTRDYLRERMAERLAPGGEPAIFDFQIQLRTDADAAVLDNPTVEWDSPFVTVATITIPPQTFDSAEQRERGEAMRFSPWHTLDAHRPLGEINEIRKAVYMASQAERAKVALLAQGNLRLSDEELRRGINDDFKEVVEKLTRTFSYLSHSKGGRATHTWGVAGRGVARFIPSTDFPVNEFFMFGKTLPIILRHSSPGAREDDRARDGAAASIKFLDAADEGPGVLDILMNAGRQLFVRTIRDFSTFVHAGPEERTALVAQGLMMEPELIEAYRIRGSFLDYYYHSWQCFLFTDAAGARFYIRFRLIPADRGPERGLPKPDFRAKGAPSMDPIAGDPRASDFLRQDWIYQVQNSRVAYILQAQLHPEPDDIHPHHEVLNSARAWSETQYPYLDLCEIRIDHVITDPAEVAALDMTPNRSPACISIPLATSPDQYASLGHGRALVYPAARAVRGAVTPPENN